MIQNIEVKATFRKEGGFKFNPEDAPRYKQFLNSLEDGQVVNCFYSVELDPREKSLGQLAKVHVLIKQLAKDNGDTVADMKYHVKKRAGLVSASLKDEIEVKSFKDCSKSELATAIEACISIGRDIGSDVY